MSESRRQEPWEDRRVDAAFDARFGSLATPAHVAEATVARLRGDGPVARPGHRWRWGGLVAAGIAALAVVTASLVSTNDRPPSGATASPSSTPDEVLGLPVIDVQAARTIRDGGVDDRELAVRGWYSPLAPMSCPAALPPTSPIEPICPDPWVVLTDEPEALTIVRDDGFEGRESAGPFIHIDLDHLDRSWDPPITGIGPATPVELVVVGHFDDRRSFACPVDVQAACRDRFVVDRIDSVDGRRLPTSVLDLVEAGMVSASDAVERLVLAVAPGSTTLSIVAVDGNPGLGRIEPSLGTGQAGLIDHHAIWSVRVLLDGRSVTYLVVDGTDVVFAIDDDGGATQVAGARPTPSATTPSAPTASPSFTSDGFQVFEVELLSPVGAGRPRPIVTVVDKAGFVAAVREVGPEDRPMGDDRSNIFDRDPDVDGRYRLFWPGSLCDREITVTIEPGAARIVVDQGARDACDALGVGRELVLDLTRSVDTTGVEVVVVPPTRAGAAAFEVEFTSPLHAGLGGPRITVVDRAGRLRAAREATDDDGPFPGDRSTGNVYVANGAPNVLRVQWIGGLCDAGMAMTIDDGVTDSIAIESGVVEDCDSLGVTRELVLTFDGPIAASSMRARLAYP